MTRVMLRHKRFVVLIWAVLALAGAGTAPGIGRHLDYTYTTPGQPGFEANLKILSRFGMDAAFEPHLAVLRLPAGQGMDTQAGQDLAAQSFAAAPNALPVAMADFATTHDPMFILDHGAASWALILQPNPDKGLGAGVEKSLPRVLQSAAPKNARLTLTGFSEMLSNGGPNGQSLLEELAVGAALAFLVLVLTYGSAIAILPIAMALPAICVTLLCVRGLTYVAEVSYFVQYTITLLSLGIAIDFSLLLVVRWREEIERGADREAAVAAACQSAGRAIMLSGLTASLGLLSLVVLPVPFLRSIGYAGMLIPFVAVAVAVTLLPVALAVVGPALDKHRLWRGTPVTYSRGWAAWGRFILRRRWLAALAGVTMLGVLSAPALSINTAEPLIGSLSQQGPAAEAFQDLRANGIPSAVDFPIQVITHSGIPGREQAAAILSRAQGVYHVVSPDTPAFRNGADSLLTVIPTAEGGTVRGKAIVTDLRQQLAGVPGGAEVGGSTAADMSFTDAVYGNFPMLLLTVSGATLVMLAISLRSVVLAAKAVILNVVSLGAAFGFMVVF